VALVKRLAHDGRNATALPLLHVPPVEHASAPQDAPLLSLHAVGLVAGAQIWQKFAGFGAPDA
jgi:hypothetical protein